MSKANQKLNGMPESGGMDRKETAQTKSRAMYWIGLCMVVSMAMLVSPVSAESINWTELISLLDGVVTIFPSIANMVAGIVPTLFYLIVVAFIMRFFNSIIGMIEGLTNIFK